MKRLMKSHALFATAIAVMMGPVLAQAQDRRPVTARDVWAMKRLAAPALSPDGQTVAFTVQEWSVEKNKDSVNVWLVPVAGGAPRRLTTAEAKDGAPVWSPDGSRIAFVSKRGDDEAAALYVIPVDGGEAEEVLEMPFGLVAPRWLPDGRHLVVATSVIPELAGTLAPSDRAAMKKEAKRRKDSKMTARATEDRTYKFFDHYLTDGLASRLIKVEVGTRNVTDLTPGFDRWFQVDGEVSCDVSPDGSWVALTINSTLPPYREFLNPDVYLVPTDGSGRLTNVTVDNPGGDSHPVWSPDGVSLYFLRTKTTYHNGESQRVWRHDRRTGQSTPLSEGLDYSFTQIRVSRDGSTLWMVAEEKGTVPVFRMNADGGGFRAVHAGGSASGLDVRGDSVAFLHTTLNRPDEVMVLDAGTGQARQITDFNAPLLAELDLGKSEAFWFEGAGGDQVHGWLVFPPGFDPSKRYPLVQVLHGGPHTMSRDAWNYRWNSHALAAPGFVLAHVNRHGSTGFGQAFAQSIVNAWGDAPTEDILKSTDILLQRIPNIDPNRVAAAGASYGGYLAAWLLGHTDRFACLVNHAGVNNSYGQFGSDVPHGFTRVMGGTPWENAEGFQRNNPMAYARNFKTPTLVTHGELDYRVPYGLGLELYGVLQSMGVPSRLVVFPNENHWILSPQNSIRWYWEVQDWLARHLGIDRTTQPTFRAAEGE